MSVSERAWRRQSAAALALDGDPACLTTKLQAASCLQPVVLWSLHGSARDLKHLVLNLTVAAWDV